MFQIHRSSPAAKPPGCNGCGLQATGGNYVAPSGLMTHGVLVVAGMPGRNDEKTASPLDPSGQAGMLFNRALRMVGQATASLEAGGLTRDSFAYTYAIACRPPYEKFEGHAAVGARNHCYDAHLAQQIERLKPRAILALGNQALQSLTTLGTGKKGSILHTRGFFLDPARGSIQVPLMAALDPAFIVANDKTSYVHMFASDLARVLKAAHSGWTGRPTKVTTQWILEGTERHLQDILAWMRDNPNAPVAYDLETEESAGEDESTIRGTEDGRLLRWSATTGEDHDKPTADTAEGIAQAMEEEGTEESAGTPADSSGRWAAIQRTRITQFQIALSRERAYCFRWTPTIQALFWKFLATNNPKFTWNGRLFDNPILRAHGAEIGGAMLDLMNHFHMVYPDWPMGLQSATSHFWPELGPWKHLVGQDFAWYGCADVASLFALSDPKTGFFARALPAIMRFEPEAADRMWKAQSRLLIDFSRVLDNMQDRGIFVDRDRHTEFAKFLQVKCDRLWRHIQHYARKYPELQRWKDDEGYAPTTTLGKRAEWAMLTGESSFTLEGDTYHLEPGTRLQVVRALNPKTGKPYKRKGEWVTEEREVATGGYADYIRKPYKLPKEAKEEDLILAPVEVSLKNPYDPAAPERRGVVLRWKLKLEFNPGSSTQILDYLSLRMKEEAARLTAAGRSVHANAVWSIPENPQKKGKPWTGTAGLKKMVGDNLKAWVLAPPLESLSAVPDGHGKTERQKWLARNIVYENADGRRIVRVLDRHAQKTRDPLLHLIVQYKAYSKIQSSFVNIWEPGPDGCVHTSFGFNPATGQLSSKKPNTQQYPKHGYIASGSYQMPDSSQPSGWRSANPKVEKGGLWRGGFRSIICAPAGRRLVTADFSGFHAVTTGFEASAVNYVRLARLDIHSYLTAVGEGIKGAEYWLERPDAELAELLGRVKEKYKVLRDTQYKRCLAEGSLILTDQGLVPIEKITLAHKLWDGVEWVKHEGLINQGIRDVIEWDGVVATPDHEVVTASGRIIPIGQAASEMERLHVTGDGAAPIRSVYGDLLRDSARERIQKAALQMYLRQGSLGGLVRKVRVYDIANAGPRRCFTTNGKLTLNCILGVQFGMQARKMSKLYPESFPTWKDAQRIVDVEKALFPEVFAWQDAQKEKAFVQRFLLSRYGFLRWFWSVKEWNTQWQKMGWGPDAEAAIAFEPANDAFGIIRECLLEFEETRRPQCGRTLADAYHLCNNVHDSIECFPPAELEEECVEAMATILTRPRKTLIHPIIAPEGLWCDVEINSGPDAANLKTVLATQSRWLKAA